MSQLDSGLLSLLTAALLLVALLVIALVPASRRTVLSGLEAMLAALVEIVRIVAASQPRNAPPPDENKKPPDSDKSGGL